MNHPDMCLPACLHTLPARLLPAHPACAPPACPQAFFRGGFHTYTGSTAYFEAPTQRQLLESHLGKQDVVNMSIQAAMLTWEIFTTVRLGDAP
jgi:hypothetical protein